MIRNDKPAIDVDAGRAPFSIHSLYYQTLVKIWAGLT